jgi:hypothetical protein
MVFVKVMSVDRGWVAYLWAKGETAERSGMEDEVGLPGWDVWVVGLVFVMGLQWLGKEAMCWAELDDAVSKVGVERS